MVVGAIFKGAKAAGRLAKVAGKQAARKGVVRATGQAGKLIAGAAKFATKLPSKVKGEVVKEIARRGGIKQAGKALVKKVIRDQAVVQSKKVVKRFIADSQNSNLEKMKNEERQAGITLRLMKEAERKNLIPKNSTPNLRQIERAVLEDKKLTDIEKEEKAKAEKLTREGMKAIKGVTRTFEESRLKGLAKCATFETNSRGRKTGCKTFKKEGEPKWFKETYCKTGETRSSCSNKRAALSGARYYQQYLPEAIKGLPKNDPRRIKYEKNKK